MRIAIARHGTAADPSRSLSDADRPLMSEGFRQARWLAAALTDLGFRPRSILSSDVLRAAQTARALGEGLGCEVRFVAALRVGGRPELVLDTLRGLDDEDRMVVGHNPQLSEALDLAMAAGARSGGHLRTGECAVLRFDEADPRASCVLVDRLRMPDDGS